MTTQPAYFLIRRMIEFGDHTNEVFVNIIGLQTALLAVDDEATKYYLGRLSYHESILIDGEIILNEVSRIRRSLGEHSTKGIIPLRFVLQIDSTMYEELEDYIARVSDYNQKNEALIKNTGKIGSISSLLERYLHDKERMTKRRARKQCEALVKVLEICEDFRNNVGKLTHACLNREVQKIENCLDTGIPLVKSMKHVYHIYQEFYTLGFEDYGLDCPHLVGQKS